MIDKIKNSKIPLWVNILQCLLIMIMLQQVYMFFFNHQAVAASGISTDGISNLNHLYEFAGRTLTMALVSIFVLISQEPKYFLIVLLMNLFREGIETIIDPLYPLANAPMSPMGDLVAHLIILGIELVAFLVVLKIVRKENRAET